MTDRGTAESNRLAALAQHITGGLPLPDGIIDAAVAADDMGLILMVCRLTGSHEGAVALGVSAGLDAGILRRHRLAAARGEALLDRLFAAVVDRRQHSGAGGRR